MRGGRCVGGGELGEEEVGARRPESWGRRREAGELGEEEGGVGAEADRREAARGLGERGGLEEEESWGRRRSGRTAAGDGEGARRPETGRAASARRRTGDGEKDAREMGNFGSGRLLSSYPILAVAQVGGPALWVWQLAVAQACLHAPWVSYPCRRGLFLRHG